MIETLGLGGGCHWCTEAVFSSLAGVSAVRQGYIRSAAKHANPAEAVEVDFDPVTISREDLLAVHLATHASTDPRKATGKYRSAIYVFEDSERKRMAALLADAQVEAGATFATQVLLHCGFTPSAETFQEYYAKNPQGAFCTNYIDPKLTLLRERFEHLRRGDGVQLCDKIPESAASESRDG
ncbi:MAG: peptide methionine sulfoxide reductase [Nevskiaceae bacterium]|jgi:peptide-methionine (S)-S-oxide reductase|nr:MAG: peptide methionine sulfoxide reductase [Nevskiaceae bacterium]